jgi:hypothetical protein
VEGVLAQLDRRFPLETVGSNVVKPGDSNPRMPQFPRGVMLGRSAQFALFLCLCGWLAPMARPPPMRGDREAALDIAAP